jgi:DNA-binding transcriptional LysR family regulator
MELITEIGIFTRVVELRSFTRAAAELGMTPSGVSRAISRLEERLGLRLLRRTTRQVGPTDDGAVYFARCSRILADLDEANLEMARARKTPRGLLRVDAPQLLGQFIVGPSLPAFLAKWPELSVDITLRDQVIDPVAEGIDVVLRLSSLEDSELVARKLGSVRTVVVGAPAYFRKHRAPRSPQELEQHECIGYLKQGSALPWRFRGQRGDVTQPIQGRLRTDSGAMMLQAALGGLGLIQVFEYWVRDQLREGTLVETLSDFEPEPRVVSALFARNRHEVPRVKVFIDFVARLFQ